MKHFSILFLVFAICAFSALMATALIGVAVYTNVFVEDYEYNPAVAMYTSEMLYDGGSNGPYFDPLSCILAGTSSFADVKESSWNGNMFFLNVADGQQIAVINKDSVLIEATYFTLGSPFGTNITTIQNCESVTHRLVDENGRIIKLVKIVNKRGHVWALVSDYIPWRHVTLGSLAHKLHRLFDFAFSVEGLQALLKFIMLTFENSYNNFVLLNPILWIVIPFGQLLFFILLVMTVGAIEAK